MAAEGSHSTLEDESDEVRLAVAQALCNKPVLAAGHISTVVSMFADGNVDVRDAAAVTVASLGVAASDHASILANRLTDGQCIHMQSKFRKESGFDRWSLRNIVMGWWRDQIGRWNNMIWTT